MKLYTLKEIALKNNVSKSAIQWQFQKIKNQKGQEYINQNTKTTETNCLCLNEILLSEIEQQLNAKSCNKNKTPGIENEKAQEIKSETSEQKIDFLIDQIDFLKSQIETKDLQIQQLNDQLTDAMSALKASQSIHALYMKQIEDKAEEPEPEKQNETNFFKRLFRGKKNGT